MICLRNQTILISRGFQFVPILGPNRSFSHVKKRKSNWVSIEIRLSEFKPISFVKRSMAMESASKSNCGTSTFILTSGVSGRVNALFSLRMWKSLLVLINAFVLVILLPFRCWKRAVVVTSSSSSSSSMEKMKNERSERKGPVVRVPAAIVSRRSGSSGGISMVAIDQTVAARRALAIRRVIQDNDGDSIRNFSLFVTSRGDTIFTQSWTPVSIKIRGLVVLVHGLNEHCDRYNDFSKELNANGLKVYGMDWIGHGGSDGLHAYIHSLDYAVSDMKSFLEKVLAENPGLPCFCFGHSTGGAIVLKALLDSKVEARVAGVVVTSPAVGVQPSHPIFAVLAPILSFLLPRYQLAAANKKGMPVSRDPEALVSKYSDPLVYTGSIRARTGYEILRISSFLLQNMQRLRVPFLVLHGTADTVTDPKASKKLYEEASSTDKTIKLLDGLLHDLLFEPEREEIMRDIIEWFSCRIQC